MELLPLLQPYQTLCFAGMCKNAGKTTLMQCLLTEDDGRFGSLAVSSIGRDGEKEDLVTGTQKPQLYIREGTLLATARGLLPFCDCSLEILEQTAFSTPLGEVYILRALSDGFVQLAGPSMSSQLMELRDSLQKWGAQKVLLDGALFRKSLCTPKLCDGVFLSTGAAYDPDMHKTVADTAFAVKLLTLPQSVFFTNPPAHRQSYIAKAGVEALVDLSSLPDTPAIYLEGAITDKRLEPLLTRKSKQPLEVCALDGTRLFISSLFYEKLLRCRIQLRLLEKNSLVAVSLNPFSPTGHPYDREQFRSLLQAALPLPVIDAVRP